MKKAYSYIPFFLAILLLAGGGFTSCSNKKEEIKSSDFPIPYPAGGEIITDEWDGRTGHRTVKYTADRHKELVSFYDNYSSNSGWKRTEAGQGDTLSIIYINLEKGYTIDLAASDDQIEGAVLITFHL